MKTRSLPAMKLKYYKNDIFSKKLRFLNQIDWKYGKKDYTTMTVDRHNHLILYQKHSLRISRVKTSFIFSAGTARRSVLTGTSNKRTLKQWRLSVRDP